MYFYAQNPFDEAVLVGDVNMTINGGTFNMRVYGVASLNWRTSSRLRPRSSATST